ncbi:MAG TPA: hypothetical protein VE077_16265 [Candidatus Methylomirabilis sp.]|nr:hypothetical protein [Candidatus Methylomirabilis sp.]
MILAAALALSVEMALAGRATPAGLCTPTRLPEATSAPQSTQDKKAGGGQSSENTGAPVGTARGKKLMLKDGSFQVVRSYEKNGERVRYFSIERGEWEEIPASLVDWEATKKAEAAEAKTDAALLEKAHIQTEEARVEPPLDVDASLTIAKGVFLPDGEGMFVLEGKTVRALQQAGSQTKTDKKTVLKQVLSPIPIVPSKRNVELPGKRATARITTATPEFYLREPAPDPDRASSVERTGRQNESGPDVMLVRAKIKGNKRYLESMRSMFGEEIGEERDEISMQRWEVAPDVYRFTLSEPLPPGEYALAEVLEDGMNLFVWDFGIDASGEVKPSAH